MATPTEQAAVVVEEIGGPEVLHYRERSPVPTPAEGEVLVKNTFSSINYVDTYFRSGFYQSQKPEILGREGVGEIVALGPNTEASGLRIGDRVAWLGVSGGYAQYTVPSVEKTVKVPDGLSLEDVAASFLGGLTILAMLDEAYAVKDGDVVLLHAAAGSVGVLFVQILKLRGAFVFATAGGDEKVRLVKSLGADHVIDYRSTEGKEWATTIKKHTNGRGVDVVFDSVGKDTWEGGLDVVRRKGTIVWFGNASGPVPPMTLHTLAPKCIKIARPTLGGYIGTRAEFDRYCQELFDLLAAKKLKVQLHKIYPLQEAQQAHVDVESRGTTGKLLLRP